MPRAWLVLCLAVMVAAAGARAECVGDCDGNGAVTVEEIVAGVTIALGTAPVAACPAMDGNGNGAVTIEELVAAVNAALGACAGTLVTDFVTQVTVIDFGVVGTLRSGAPPPPSGGPTVDVPDSATVINGGTAQTTLTASEPFSTVYFGVVGSSAQRPAAVQGAIVLGAQTAGYYELPLPEPVQQVTLQVTLAQDVPSATFGWIFQVANGGGAVSEPATTAVEVVPVGTGDVQISVSWDQPADVDLHVVDPSGEEIYYGNNQSNSGGTLDLDSNPACDIDGINNENITWPTGQAPRGTYIVRVDYYDSCGVGQTNYVVTVQRSGTEPETFTGRFTGPGDGGAAGAGVTITEFSF